MSSPVVLPGSSPPAPAPTSSLPPNNNTNNNASSNNAPNNNNMITMPCHKCQKQIQIDTDKSINDSTVSSFNTAFNLSNKDALDLTESFVVLPTRSANNNNNNAPSNNNNTNTYVTATIDKKQQILTRIFEIASQQCQQDKPMCISCYDLLVLELERKLNEINNERAVFERTLSELKLESESDASGLTPEEEEEDRRLDVEEKIMHQKLIDLKIKKSSLNQELKSLQKENEMMDEFEQRFWQDYQDYQYQLQNVSNEQVFLEQQISMTKQQLERLNRTNVYDDSFHISWDGYFATINNFRLGRLAAQPIEWAETSAALGQVCLCLHTLAKHQNYKFTKYKLIPMGSYSKMAKLDEPDTLYELYGSTDLMLGKLFWYRRFDTALVGLLQCMTELGEYAKSQDATFQWKYPIANDMIGDRSIKLQFATDVRWTQACKYMLTNLKLLLVWCVKRGPKRT